MRSSLGAGFHPIAKASTFSQEILSEVSAACKDTAVARRLFPPSMENSFERERDGIMSALYGSVRESCKGAVSLSSTRDEASSIVRVAEESLGVSDGGPLDHMRLGSLALSMHQILAKKLEAAEGSPGSSYASECLEKSRSFLTTASKRPLAEKMYREIPALISELREPASQKVISNPSLYISPSPTIPSPRTL